MNSILMVFGLLVILFALAMLVLGLVLYMRMRKIQKEYEAHQEFIRSLSKKERDEITKWHKENMQKIIDGKDGKS